ncbi:MAG: 8-amino-7-oxononanoate synthase [Kofleriaceae bacterium]|nr:8-amino-7-oxononanoate synthase [Kofleriaceae bacterium]
MDFLKADLEQLAGLGLTRSLRRHDDRPGRLIEIDGNTVLNFSSNNYLGLANHPDIVAASKEALVCGTGSSASRLVTGNLALHQELESELADFHGVEAVRIFNSGYQANIGLIACIAGDGDLIVSDELNHASMIDGCRLSRAAVSVYQHCNVDSLRECFGRAGPVRRIFVLTESVFSMDGDCAPLEQLRAVCDEFGAFLVVDDVHSLGVFGAQGAGLCAELGVVPDALVGGLGKAFGSFGGYVAGSQLLSEFLLHKARSFVFSTGLPAAVLGASIAALRVIRSVEGQARRETLQKRISQFRLCLEPLGLLETNSGFSPIFPIVVGNSTTAMNLTELLLSEGVFCQAIRPPTVKEGTARLRVSLSSLHTEEDIDTLICCLRDHCQR